MGGSGRGWEGLGGSGRGWEGPGGVGRGWIFFHETEAEVSHESVTKNIHPHRPAW